MVFGSSFVGVEERTRPNNCRGSLYIAPTDPGPYDLILGEKMDGTRIENVIKAGPIFMQLHDWNHYPTEHLAEEWEKA